MTKYEKLVKALRLNVECGNAADALANASRAADAIEELEEKVQAYAETLHAYENPWISVTERLPEDKLMVIGFTPCDGFMFVGYHVTSVWNDRDFSYWNIVTAMRSTRKMTKKVTHWMPLPKAPKGV